MQDNLQPFGGGAIVNEIDGNLTLWFGDGNIELSWTKVRGPQFNPRFFSIHLGVAPTVIDKDGAMIRLPVMRPKGVGTDSQRRRRRIPNSRFCGP